MRLEFTLAGVSPLIMHNGAAGLDTRSALRREIAALTAKRGGNGTAVDDQRPWEVECRRSLYLDADGRPTLPEAALRRMIENGARKTKQGGLVREGLMIESVTFRYEVERYGNGRRSSTSATRVAVDVAVQRRAAAASPAPESYPLWTSGSAAPHGIGAGDDKPREGRMQAG